jgi:hypothetical protein
MLAEDKARADNKTTGPRDNGTTRQDHMTTGQQDHGLVEGRGSEGVVEYWRAKLPPGPVREW